MSIKSNAQPKSVLFSSEYNLQPEKTDSAQIIGLLTKIDSIKEADLGKAMLMTDSALKLSRAIHFFYGIGNTYIAFAAIAVTAGNYKSCDSFLKMAYPFCVLSTQMSRTNALLALWFQNKGNLAAYTGNYKQSVFCSLHALELLKKEMPDFTYSALKK